ncbi:hypothetical protein [Nocardioides sp.]|uniref:hypothetical protein n=1 Tax=Nocardioides sp. TaxID=35761 RepID=UPI003562F656
MRAPHVRKILMGGLSVVLGAGALAGVGAPSQAAPPGDLDRSFSHDGRAIIEFGRLVAATDVLVLRNHKVVTVGVSNGRFAIARRTRNGKPDRTFSKDGRTSTRVGGGAYVTRVIPLRGGRILVAGAVSGGDQVLVRYLRNGRIDRAFGRNGRVRTRLPAWESSVEDLVLDSRGRILTAGIVNYEQFVRVRYTRRGQLDRSFGDEGISLTTEPLPSLAYAATVRLQRDGLPVVAGWRDLDTPFPVRQMFVARYADDGTLDSSFGGGDGWTSLGEPSDDARASTLLVRPDGRLLLGGGARESDGDGRAALGRVQADGEPDPSFGDDGLVTHSFDGVPGAINGLSRQRNGMILATGTTSGAFTLARYRPNGSVDSRFASDGITETVFQPRNGGHSSGRAVANRGNRIVVVGGHYTGSDGDYDGDFAIARFRKR